MASGDIEKECLGNGKLFSRESIEQWLILEVAAASGISTEMIDIDKPFHNYGLSSLNMMKIIDKLNVRLEKTLPSTIAFDYPNIQSLVRHVSGEDNSFQAFSEEGPIFEGGTSVDNCGTDVSRESVAVIGMACRFPGGCNSPEEFWDLLVRGGDGICEVPSDRWDIEDYFDPDPDAPGKMNTRWGGFISDIDRFDAAFFGISPREAELMDVQQRLLLEVCWESLENAGEISDKLPGSRTGVFVGISGSDYGRRLFEKAARLDLYYGTGGAASIAANRVSYVLGLRGPSLAIDTACSSSLVAVHLACRSLLSGECSLALAGGVNAIIAPEMTIVFSKAKLMAPDGRCKTFDSSADGYVRSEGCGMVVLKRLSDALRDRDNIICVIRGTYINQDGHSNGLTVPNGLAQQELLRGALTTACLKPADIQYVETHGTGTAVGDPVEVRSLGEVMKEGRARDNPLVIGSVKTNIGHLEQAAGIAGLIKVILALNNEEIPPHLHFNMLNPQISIADIPAIIPTSAYPWPRGKQRRLAGISGFSFGGVNAHIIVEEAPEVYSAARGSADPYNILCVSAKSENALKNLCARYKKAICQNTALRLDDMCYTANTGRAHFPYRLALVADSSDLAARQLSAFEAGEAEPGVITGHARSSRPPRVAFLFTGQGSQYVNMGREFYDADPVFQKTINECAVILDRYLDHSLISLLFDVKNPSIVDQTKYAQPLLFAVEYALASMWQSWGIKPEAIMGHSVGEYVAACVAGVFSLEDGLRLIAARGHLMQALPSEGMMAAIFASEERVGKVIRPYSEKITLAALNGPENTVISGISEYVEKVIAFFEEEGIGAVPLKVSHAFHSPLITPMIADFEKVSGNVAFGKLQIPLVSNISGRFVEEREICNTRYWSEHIRRPVQFARSMQAMNDQGFSLFLEIGPNPVLSGMGKQCLPEREAAWLYSLKHGESGWKTIMQSMAMLYVRGATIDWPSFYANSPCKRVPIPTYQFERRRFWFDSSMEKNVSASTEQIPKEASEFHPAIGKRVFTPFPAFLYEYHCSSRSNFLSEHRICGVPVMPGAVFISMVMACVRERYPDRVYQLSDTVIKNSLHIPEDSDALIQVVLTPKGGGTVTFQCLSVGEKERKTSAGMWREHLAGVIKIGEPRSNGEKVQLEKPWDIQKRCQKKVSGADFYQSVEGNGLLLGPRFRWVDNVWVCQREALAEVRLPGEEEKFPAGQMHPGLIDVGAQLLFAYLPLASGITYMFLGCDAFVFYGEPEGRLWCHLTLSDDEEDDRESISGDYSLFNEDGLLVAEATGVQLIRVSRERLLDRIDDSSVEPGLYHEIVWVPLDRKKGLAERSGQGVPKKWVILADDGGTGSRLAELLERGGDRCILVYAGSQYRQLFEGNYSINHFDPESYQKLVQEVFRAGKPCDGIVHLWSLNMSSMDKLEGKNMEEDQVYGVGSTLFLLQCLLDAELPDNPRFWLITRGCQAVLDQEGPCNVPQASLWGLGKVLALEYSEFWGGLIDLDPQGTDDVQNLLRELLYPSGEDLLAFRHGQPFATRLTPGKRIENTIESVQLEANATYLVTGGTGGLGMSLVPWLVSRGARSLVLVSRNGLSLDSNQILDELKIAGVDLSILKADVNDQAQLQAVFDTIHDDMFPLRGVFHLAGVLDDGMLQQQTWERFTGVMRPKIGGAYNLHMMTRDVPLQYFVLFSSVASMLGAPGQGNYAAANAVMDSLAHHRRALGLHALSINWGPWEGRGMTASLTSPDLNRWKERGYDFLNRDQGLGMLQDLLKYGSVQGGVFSLNWSKYLDTVPPGILTRLISGYVKEPREEGVSLPFMVTRAQEPLHRSYEQASETGEAHRSLIMEELRQLAGVQLYDRVVEQVQKMVSETLYFEDAKSIDTEQQLIELGLDSLMIIGLRSRIKKEYNANIPLNEIMRKPTISSLARSVLHYMVDTAATKDESDSLPSVRTDSTDRHEPFPLTDVQYAYWVGRRGDFELGDVSCHVYVEVEIDDLDLDRLGKAITALVQRHEMLRAIILPDGTQRILEKTDPYKIEVLDLTGMGADDANRQLESLRYSISHAVHQCETGPLFEIRASLIDTIKTRLHISFDLLIGDGWTFNILIRDLYALYKDPGIELPQLELSFRDYVLAELALRQTRLYQRSLDYWRSKIADMPPAPELPMIKHPGDLARTRFSRLASSMVKEDWEQLKKKAGQAGLTASGILLAAFAEVIGRWSKSPRFTIMLTLFNRLPMHPQVNDLAGDFTSLIALAIDTAEKTTFLERARIIQEHFWDDMEHRYVSGVQVLRELGRIRGKEAGATLPVVFTSVLPYSGTSTEETSALGLPADLPVDYVYGISQTPQVWLDFQIYEQSGTLLFNWDVVDELFPAGMLQDMFDSYCQFISRLASQSGVWNESSPVNIPATQLKQRELANSTGGPVSGKLLHSLFLEQVNRQPWHEAVVTPRCRMTYGELFTRAGKISQLLREKRVRPNKLVAIIMEKGWEQVVAAMGILMSGAAYLPIDPALPQERVWHMLVESEADIILTQSFLDEASTWPEGTASFSVDIMDPVLEHPGDNLSAEEIIQRPEDLAYVIYTSGSTGFPKGVMISHLGAVNTILDINDRFQVGPGDRILGLSNLSFDLSVYDIFGVLAAGGTLVMCDPEQVKDPALWCELLQEEKITIWNSVPALMEMLVEYLSGKQETFAQTLRLVLMSGDWIPVNLPGRIREMGGDAVIASLGGATEASIWSIVYPITETGPGWKSIPYGKPLSNQRFYVLNEALNPCPDWVPGQLYIVGLGLALGYWKDEEKTNNSFIINPRTGERLYRTGDQGCYRPDGNIEFLGREDLQVKILGHRIELGEIEENIKAYPGVREAVVVAARDQKGAKYLAGFVVTQEDECEYLTMTKEDDPEEARAGCDITSALRNYLRQRLPDYMIPLQFQILDAIPLTSNGKVDRKALAEQGVRASKGNRGQVAPRTGMEARLAGIWGSALDIEMVGVCDSFFELGGDSLTGIQLINRVRDSLSVEISLRDLFLYPTVELLARHVEKLASRKPQDEQQPELALPLAVPDRECMWEPFMLTDVQQAYWLGRTGFFDLGGVSTHSYFEIEGRELDLARLSRSWQRLIDHHGMMRAVILPNGQQQRILPEVPAYEIGIVDLRESEPEAVKQEMEKIREEMSHQVLSTEKWPLFDIRAVLWGDGRVRLHISFDNIIFDGWSILYLFKEWGRLYFNPEVELLPPELSFRDYLLAVSRLEGTSIYNNDVEYWSARIPQLPPAPELPLAKNPSEITNQRFRRLEHILPAPVWMVLKERIQQENLTPSGFLLAAYAEILGMWSKTLRFTINLTLFNRLQVHPRVLDLVGDFTSLTLLAVDGSGGKTFSERARNIQRRLWEDLDHSYLGGVKVLREYGRLHGINPRSAAMPVVFTSALGISPQDPDASGISQLGELVYNITQTPQVWLDHQVYENAGNLVLIWDAVEELFPPGLLEDMFEAYCALLQELVEGKRAWQQPTRVLLPLHQREAIAAVNATDESLSGEMLHTLFVKQALKQPLSPAVVSCDRTLTYGELYRRSWQVARLLQERGARPNTLVAVVMAKGWEQVVAVMGVLMSGAAYLPIDPEVPQQRLWYMLQQGEAGLALTQSVFKERLVWPEHVQTFAVDEMAFGDEALSALNPCQKTKDLAYVIFTSGSTGFPKGVMIDHQGAVNTILNINRRFGIIPGDRVLAVSSLSFDLSVYDIFGLLAAGGTIVMPQADRSKDPAYWARIIEETGVTLWNSVPALMRVLVDNLTDRGRKLGTSLRLVLLSGDWIPVTLPNVIRDLGNGIEVISLGGATEASIWSVCYPIGQVEQGWKSIPYGRPLTNQSIRVLNASMDDCPVWVPGQLYIGGSGLAKGYWRDEVKTRESFIVHPATGQLLYRTGDLGRYLPDGNVEFLGREDFQVKVRGYRIELGEIEATLKGCGDITDAVVLTVDDGDGNKRLVSFVIPRCPGEYEQKKVLAYLADRLPDYMIPQAVVCIESFPLTPNGKIDRKLLSETRIEAQKAEEAYAVPQNELEEIITSIVQETLGIDELGTQENLFDAGANSLHMLRLQGKLEQALQRDIDITYLFEHQNVVDLARFLGSEERLPGTDKEGPEACSKAQAASKASTSS